MTEKTRVFISWSGNLSKQIGEAIKKWLPVTLQFVEPYFSPDDIDKGTRWEESIGRELRDSDVGITCLTRESKERPWLLFEAGALFKGLSKSRVCTVLFDLKEAEVKFPLAMFQHTRFEKEDFKKLITTINNATPDENRVASEVLDEAFDERWPKLKKEVEEILSNQSDPQPVRRPQEDMVSEILELTRSHVQEGGSRYENRVVDGLGADVFSRFLNALIATMRERNITLDSRFRYLAQHLDRLARYMGCGELAGVAMAELELTFRDLLRSPEVTSSRSEDGKLLQSIAENLTKQAERDEQDEQDQRAADAR